MPVEKAKLPDGREVNTSERFEQGRNFANKFWNAARFALMNLEGYEPGAGRPRRACRSRTAGSLTSWPDDRAATTADLEDFRFAEATRRLRDFTWNDFCDWYLEFVKGRLRDPEPRPVAQRVLAAVLDGLCRLLHPIMPFVTEQVWQALGQARADARPARARHRPRRASASRPGRLPDGLGRRGGRRTSSTSGSETITAIRNLRAERNVPEDGQDRADHRGRRRRRRPASPGRGVPAEP